jgi:outer membrane receptor protein involved in Fe transport
MESNGNGIETVEGNGVRKSILAPIVAAVLSAFAIQNAVGQEAQGGQEKEVQALEEIVVTAQRREQVLQEVPIAITAITGRQLKEYGVRDIEDISYFVPSFSAPQYSPGGRAVLVIRGLGSVRGNSALTGLYLDEAAVAVSPVAALNVIPIDLERVEVLKGPQGTLYGEGSVGGTVRYITNKADLEEFSGHADASSYGTDGSDFSYDVTGVLNVPIVPEKLAIRFASYYENAAGWINRADQSETDINDNELFDIRTKVLFKPVEALEIDGTVIIHRNKAGAENIANTEPRSESIFRPAIVPNTPLGSEDDYEFYNLTGTYDFGAASLLSSTAYATIFKSAVGQSQTADTTIGLFDALADQITDIDIFTQEIRLNSNGSGPLEWVIGGFYRDSEIESLVNARTVLGNLIPPPGSTGSTRLKNFAKAWAVFGDGSIRVGDRLRIGGGLRYFEEDREEGSENLIAGVVNPTLNSSFDDVSSRVFISYELRDGFNLYASRAEGFRSGGANSAASVAAGGPPMYDPEELTTYELGAKTSLQGGRISAEVALFHNDFEEIQFVGIQPGGVGGFTGNVGAAEMKGIDLSVQVRPTDSFTFGLSGSVIDAEITNIGLSQTSHVVGDPIDFVPDYSYSITAGYEYSWKPNVPGFARLAYNEQGPASQLLRSFPFLEPVNTSDVLNFLSASVGAAFGSFNVELFGQNLLNEDDRVSPSYVGWWPQARPRTLGVRFGAEF